MMVSFNVTPLMNEVVMKLIAPFFLEKDLTKENIISNKAACQVISHLGKIPIFIFLFDLNYLSEYKLLTPLIISVYLGTYFGKKILSNIHTIIIKKSRLV